MNRYFFVENLDTGARAEIPISEDKLDFYRKHRDVPIGTYVRNIRIPLDEVQDWNGEDHCIFGMWESIRQHRTWGDVYRAITGSTPNNIEIGITQ